MSESLDPNSATEKNPAANDKSPTENKTPHTGNPHEDKTEHIKRLEGLKSKLVELENQRQSQGRVKSVGIWAIIGLLAYITLSVYFSFAHFEKEKFVTNLKKELSENLQPRLDRLSVESRKELLPLIKKEVADAIKKRMPSLEKRTKMLGELTQKAMAKQLASALSKMLEDIEKDLKDEVTPETYAILFEGDEYQQILAEELYAIIDGNQKITEVFIDEIEMMKLANPDIMALSNEDAEKLFLTSLLDLMKYNIDPKLNKKN